MVLVVGGGVGISVHGRYTVATENTVWAMPEAAIGIFPDVGMSYVLPRLGPVGIYLALTGHRLNGADCLHLGLAAHYVPSSQIAALKASLVNGTPIEEALQNATIVPEPSSLDMDQINECFEKNNVLDIISTLKGLDTEWAQKTLAELQQASPTGIFITLELMKRGKNASLKECFQAEYCVAHHMVSTRYGDFYEGVRAKLIEKTGNPAWNPVDFDQVLPQTIQVFLDAINNADVKAHLNFYNDLDKY